MALALRLFLLLLLAVALSTRAAQAAPLQARRADEHTRKASSAAWLNEDFQGLNPPAGVSAGKTFQAPFLVAAHKPRSHGRGPPRGRNKPRGDSKSLEASKQMDRIWSDLERQRDMEGEPVLKAEFPRGSSGSMVASAAGREAMPGTGPGDWERDFHHWETLLKHSLRMLELGDANPAGESDLASQPTSRTEPRGDAEVMDQKAGLKEVFPQGSRGSLAALAAGRKAMPETGTGTADAAGTTTPVPDAEDGLGRGFYMGTGCWAGLMAGLLILDLIIILCCVKIWCNWKKKRSTSGTSQVQPNTSVMENLACRRASLCQCPLSLPQVYYQLVAGSMLQALPRTDPSLPEGTGLAAHPGQEVQPSSQGIDYSQSYIYL
ncbi:uncharacterized protein LOC135292066 [Passer domesticus]|uniref:uncharacterized protein LOC135292066 n=1 Tax=Passer domesticus TaxID=48849 RepID=UPI0030FF218A